MNAQAISAGARLQVNSFLGAVVFLTRIPVGSLYHFQRTNLSRSVIFFPLVGPLIGSAGGIILAATHAFLPASIAVLLCMATTTAMTGGLHEDGLADAADGLLGGRNAADRLEIMKDSRLGTFGALTLWFSLTAKFLFLNTLLSYGAALTCAALIVANTLGRAAAVCASAAVSGDGNRRRLFQTKNRRDDWRCLGAANQFVELASYLVLAAEIQL